MDRYMEKEKFAKLKQIREQVKRELEHIPRGSLTQNELRMLYWMMRMHSLGEKTATKKIAKEVLEECITYLRKEYPHFEFQYDKGFFISHSGKE